MKVFALLVINLLLLIPALSAHAQETNPKLTNEDVVKMVQAGLSADQIMSKIKKSETDFDTSPSALVALPKRGVPNEILLAMLESDPLGSNTPLRKNGKRMTAAEFQELRASVLTVWSEVGSGTGFIFDEAGLVLTSNHVIGSSKYIAVQFDRKRKIPAKLLASDRETDVAVLWVNLAMIPDAGVARLADPESNERSIAEGERVFTIGSPLHDRKVFTAGVASKVDSRVIVCDINLDSNDSGGPLFNSLGETVGMTTFLPPEIAGRATYATLRIEQTYPLIEQARRKMNRTSSPVASFLPVDPQEPFPLETIKTAKQFDMTRYSFDVGDFSVLVMTPAVRYRLATATQISSDDKRLEELKKLRGYVRADRPVLFIYAAPLSNESFHEMHLFCGEREVVPIHPAKLGFVTAQDVTFGGIYAYPPNAISSDCGTVKLEISSERTPQRMRTTDLDRKVIARVDEEFMPYYQKYGRPSLALLEPRGSSETTLTKSNKWMEFSKPRKQK